MNKWTLGQLGKTNPKRTQTNPNLKRPKVNVTDALTKGYENKSNWAICENEPNSNPIQTQFQRQKYAAELSLFMCRTRPIMWDSCPRIIELSMRLLSASARICGLEIEKIEFGKSASTCAMGSSVKQAAWKPLSP